MADDPKNKTKKNCSTQVNFLQPPWLTGYVKYEKSVFPHPLSDSGKQKTEGQPRITPPTTSMRFFYSPPSIKVIIYIAARVASPIAAIWCNHSQSGFCSTTSRPYCTLQGLSTGFRLRHFPDSFLVQISCKVLSRSRTAGIAFAFALSLKTLLD